MYMWGYLFFMGWLAWLIFNSYDRADSHKQTVQCFNRILEENLLMQDRLLKILERVEQAKINP